VGPRPIVIYAATGYTGRLIAGELLDPGERVVLAGRDATKLNALAQRFGEGVAAVAAARRVTVAYHVEGFDMTRGTMHSSLEQMNGLDVAYEDGAWIPGGRRPGRAFVTFPPPIGRRVVARYPAGETITVPRHVATRELIARISAASIAPAAVAPVVPALRPLLGRLLRSPLKALVGRAIDTLPEGPDEEDRRAVRWQVDMSHPARIAVPA
jgi:short subunit dehydrogenase-like uncharacterized protein